MMPKKVELLCMRTEDPADTVTVSAASVLSVQLDLVLKVCETSFNFFNSVLLSVHCIEQ